MDENLSIKKTVAYSLPAFSLALVGIPLYVYIPKFYTDVIGINITAMGVILLLIRIFDAVTDPLIGFLSDRTVTMYGRRRPFLAIGSILMVVSVYLLFNPFDLSVMANTIWFGIWIFMVFLFWTFVVVPYESLGPELIYDYNKRTTLFAVRDGALIAGTLSAASAPLLITRLFKIPATDSGEKLKFFIISIIYIPVILSTIWFCIAAIKEKVPAKPVARNLNQENISVFKNRPFVILLLAYTISAIGNNLPATLILYYVQYVLKSNSADIFLFLYFITGILFLPFWIKISGKFGKKEAWLASITINTGAFLGVFFLGAGDTTLYSILIIISGIGFGATLAIPSSIQADVIDYDELKTASRREGQYIGIWSVSKKLAAAVGIGAGLAILGMVGYKPNEAQNPQVVFTLRVLYALVPCLFNLIALIIASYYPIDAKTHKKIREDIKKTK
ncbi:MAG: MFS transporter [Spirochaetes bacterium]|nr:MFS transporter [Spirochaetota bacterium]